MATQKVVGVVAQMDWMQPLEEGLQKAIHAAFAGGGSSGQKAKNFLHGTWIGHRLHVILTDVPIGAWTAATVFDSLDSATARNHWQVAADSAIAVGLVGAAAAAVAGLTDWQDTDPPARRIGLTHGLLNVGGVTLFTASLLMRKRKRRRAGLTLSILGYAVATLAARLGGNMGYGHRVGVDHTAGQELPKDFVRVLSDPELIEGQPRRADFQGVPILLLRRGGRIFALAETCSHMGGPLRRQSDRSKYQMPLARFPLCPGRWASARRPCGASATLPGGAGGRRPDRNPKAVFKRIAWLQYSWAIVFVCRMAALGAFGRSQEQRIKSDYAGRPVILISLLSSAPIN